MQQFRRDAERHRVSNVILKNIKYKNERFAFTPRVTSSVSISGIYTLSLCVSAFAILYNQISREAM